MGLAEVSTPPAAPCVSHGEEFREFCRDRDEETLTLLPARPMTMK